MSAQAAFREALTNGDVTMVMRLHSAALPHLPAPKTRDAAEAAMHMARSQADWLNDNARCYSHAWLVERGLPSQLPDRLKPKAERLYPRIVEAVLISANTNSPFLKPVVAEVQRAMSDAVEDCFANGDRDPETVRERMQDARVRTFKQLLGTTGGNGG